MPFPFNQTSSRSAKVMPAGSSMVWSAFFYHQLLKLRSQQIDAVWQSWRSLIWLWLSMIMMYFDDNIYILYMNNATHSFEFWDGFSYTNAYLGYPHLVAGSARQLCEGLRGLWWILQALVVVKSYQSIWILTFSAFQSGTNPLKQCKNMLPGS